MTERDGSDIGVDAMPNFMTAELPGSWLEPLILNSLSADGQLYLRCGACEAESRAPIMSVAKIAAKTAKKAFKEACGGCGAKGKLHLVVHAVHSTIQCLDCDAAIERVFTLGEPLACDTCHSAHVEIADEDVRPPFPPTVLQIEDAISVLWSMRKSKGAYKWGSSGESDSKRIHAESQMLTLLPDCARYLNLLVAFADRLRGSHADTSRNGRYWMENIVGNLSKDLLRRTGRLLHGLLALDCFSTMIEIAEGPFDRALAQHSFAMGSFTLLANLDEDYLIAASGDPDFRLRAVAIADEAAGVFEQAAKKGDQAAAVQLSRIHYVIGDLLRVGKADDQQRRKALYYFGLALKIPAEAQSLGFGIAESFASTVLALADPTADELREAVDLLEPTLGDHKNDRQLANVWRGYYTLSWLRRRRGEWKEAYQAVRRAAAHALQQFNTVMDERVLLQQAETFVPVFENVACIFAANGMKDDALNAIELSRAASLRVYTMSAAAREAHLEEIERRQHEDMVPPVVRKTWGEHFGLASQRDFVDFLWDNPIDPAADRVLSRFGDETAAYLSIFLSEEIATGIVWARHGDGRQTLDVTQWKPDREKLAWLREQRYVEPGPFREPLLAKTANYSRELFLEPLLPVLEAVQPKHLIISLPGVFSRLPLEAVFRKTPTAPNAEIALSYLPSLWVGSDIWESAGGQAVAPERCRLLLVGYGGDDMPHLAEEASWLREIWGDRIKVLDGEKCNKRSVLDAMGEPYDIIHFMCHGTYDSGLPLRSALHFRPDPDNDALRVTAADLLNVKWLVRRPIVILSACSSGLTADVRTNSFHGLPGSFFRIGARAIIGSRWPVHDDVAASLMRRLHENLSRTPGPLDTLLANAIRSCKDAGSTEDFAAFGVFGMA